MENAAKALLIAGGVLLSLLIISLLLLMTGVIGERARFSEEQRAMRELIRFNSRFEAFDKQILSGQDVISAINMAIDNNERPDHDQDGPMFINIVLTVNRPFEQFTETVTIPAGGGHPVRTERILPPLRPGTYSLRNSNSIHNADMNRGFIDMFTKPSRPVIDGPHNTNAGVTTTTTFHAMHDFRNARFYSVPGGVRYNDNGRITDIHFRQRSGS